MRTLKLWLPVIVWAGLILLAATDLFSAQSTGGWLRSILGFDPPRWLHFAIRKGAHLTVYAILAALAWRADHRWQVVMAIALAVAMTDETMQSFSMRRTGSPWDVGIDLIGAGLAISGLRRR